MIGLVAVTAAGRAAATRLAAAWPGETQAYDGPAGTALPEAFGANGAVVVFLAVGATVRLLAPLLGSKHDDPGVVCVDEALRFAVPVVGAHAGGGNDLARRVAGVLGAEPVITTASDSAGSVALDEFGADLDFVIEPGSQLAAVGTAILSGQRVTFSSDLTWPVPPLPPNVVRTDPEPGVPAILVTDGQAPDHDAPTVIYRPPSLVAGLGASRGVPAEEVGALIDEALATVALSPRSVRAAATADLKADEEGLLAAVRERGWPLVTFPVASLATVAVPHPSETVRAAVGTPSVAEAAALLAASYPNPNNTNLSNTENPVNNSGPVGPTNPISPEGLIVPKRTSAHATVAIARTQPRGRLAIVGIGPGARDLLTARAVAELRRATIVVGLDQYLRQVEDLLRPGTTIRASGLGQEQERAEAAVADAAAGHAVALIGSGDAGVYAMGSPALEAAGQAAVIDVIGVPGVTAALAAAAVLGAPLGHDHTMISLSDLHTPWEIIERRVTAAAEADLVVCFYNPASQQRDWQLRKALAILAGHRPPGTPVGWVRDATRPGQSAGTATLAAFDPAVADMRTLVVVGSSRTRLVAGRMVTPREYRWAGTS
jgi:cobalt-precorrin 5A hydrolase / precorrin-3B C17-methyltransferase